MNRHFHKDRTDRPAGSIRENFSGVGSAGDSRTYFTDRVMDDRKIAGGTVWQ
ncbi:hypothetical protein J2741_000325 [Methanolinea mesophila]|uniref:hypothetical protein n=1 Tax=Methanolinea mesophila TaxID=547055 RepID=UPI001AE5BF64|nr:hypothetical protein [Methanolinea mesophila]MBP1927778.1 hypothetical protein [Methanolinea mesophila]